MIMKKKLVYFILILFLPFATFSQNCNLSNAQLAAFQAAQESIFEVKDGNDYKPGLTDIMYKNLIDKCVEALNISAYCSQDDIYRLYSEILHAYNVLANMGTDAELYYYEQAVYYSNRAINTVTDPDRKEIFRRVLKENQSALERRKTARTTTEREKKDDYDYFQASVQNTFVRWAEYVRAFPNGLHISEADDNLFNIAKKFADVGITDYLQKYLLIRPNGNHVADVKKILDKPKDDDAFQEAQNAGTIEVYKEYLSKFPRGYHVTEANSTLAQLYINKGDTYFAEKNYQSAQEHYKTANQYSYSDIVNDKIRNVQACIDELRLYEKIKNEKNKNEKKTDCNSYLNLFPQGQYAPDVLAILKSINEEDERQLYEQAEYSKSKNICDDYLTKYPNGKYITEISTLRNQIQKEEDRIARKEKRIAWNKNIRAGIYYSYTFQPSPLTNAADMHGVSVNKFSNGTGYYYSFRSNARFFTQKVEETEFMPSTVATDSCISSAAFSIGITKKIYRPVFFTAGISAGINTFAEKHAISTGSDNSLWTYSNDNRSHYLAPELGLSMIFSYFTIGGKVNYLFPLNETPKIVYNGKWAYSLDIGFTIKDKRYNSDMNFFLTYNFDFPTLSYLDFKTNASIIGLSFGVTFKRTWHGLYLSCRTNPLLFSRDFKNSQEKSNLFGNFGYWNQMLYPLGFYVSPGIAYQKSMIDSKIQFNPEWGLNLSIGNLFLRGGINIPSFRFRYDNIYYSFGIGYIGSI
jgi:hypothetical protein